MIADEINLERLQVVLRAVLTAMGNAGSPRKVDRLAQAIWSLPDLDQAQKGRLASGVLRYGEDDPTELVVECVMNFLLDK
jgi:hypothetical protein